MKKIAILGLCGFAVAISVFGFLQVVPILRNAIETQRHIRRAAQRAPGAEADWRREFGDPDRTLGTFPKVEDNESAIRLIGLARGVEVDLARTSQRWSPLEETGDLRVLKRAISRYVQTEVTKTGGPIDPPPDRVATFLKRRDGEIQSVVEHLLSPEPPVWASDVSLGYQAPTPNGLGQLLLQRLLVARTLSLAARGENRQAEQAFRASWNLNATLRDRADVVSQLIAIGVARMHAGLLRRLALDSDSWRERLLEHDYRESVLRAMEVEAIGAVRLWRTDSTSDRASRADFLDARRKLLVRLRDSPPFEEKTLERRSEESRSPGAVVQAIGNANLPNALHRADRLMIDMELTERILRARAMRARLGHWPSAIPGIEKSRMTGERWSYSTEPEGSMRISFSTDLRWDAPAGWMLPLRYESN